MAKMVGGINSPVNESQGGTNATTFTQARANLNVASTTSEKTLAYTAILGDNGNVIRYTGAGGVNLSLTAAASLGNGWNVTLRNDSAGTITIDPSGAETINGVATLPVTANQTVQIFCNGALFFTLGSATASGAITLTGEVTGTGTGTVATTISAGAVDLTNLDSVLSNTAFNAFIGMSVEEISATAASDGVNVTLTFQKTGGGDVTLIFSGGAVVVDCTPALTTVLTQGTDAIAQANYVYILKSAPTVLSVSLAGFPLAVEFFPVCVFLVQTAASFQTYGPYKSIINHGQIWKDTTQGGDVFATSLWILNQRPIFLAGSLLTPTLTPGTPDILTFALSVGTFLKLRRLPTPAFNSATVGSTNLTTFFVTNLNAGNFAPGKDLYNFRQTAAGATAANNDIISWVIWGSLSENSTDYAVYVNLPSGFYTTSASAIADDSRFANYNIPQDFVNTGFLICKLSYQYSTAGGGDLTLIENLDLRGSFPNSTAGGTTISGANAQLSNLSAVAINTNMVAGTNNTTDLGTALIRWRDMYLDGQLRSGQTIGNTYELTARDVDGLTDTPFITFTAGNTPTCALAAGVTGVTQTNGANNTTLATTAYTDNAILVGTAPPGAQYLTLTASGQLTQERVFTPGGGLGFVNSGGGNPYDLFSAQIVNEQTIGYTALTTDRGKVIRYTGAGGVTLALTAAATLLNGWYTTLRNDSSGNITIDPAGAETINGTATLVVTPGNCVQILCNGTLFYTLGTAASAGGGGLLLQAVQTVKTDVFTSTSATYIDITGMSATITPASTASRIKVTVTMPFYGEANNFMTCWQILRGATPIFVGDTSGTAFRATSGMTTLNNQAPMSTNAAYIDSPASAAPVTYKIQGVRGTAATSFSVNGNTTTSASTYKGASSIILEEYAS